MTMLFDSVRAAIAPSPVSDGLGALPQWRLEDLYESMDSQRFAEDMDRARREAKEFAETWRGKLGAIADSREDGEHRVVVRLSRAHATLLTDLELPILRADEAASAIRNMAANIDQSVQAFQQIVAGTNQQQIGFENVTQALKDMSRASEQAAVSNRQTEKAAKGLTEIGAQLRSATKRYQL